MPKPKQKELFRIVVSKLTDDEIEVLGVKYLGNVYYYYPDEIKKLIIAIEKKIRGINDKR